MVFFYTFVVMMQLVSYPLSVLYLLFLGLTLIIFHPIQWIAFNFFGYSIHKKTVDILQYAIMKSQLILGVTYTFKNPYNIDANSPLIMVSNHQSMFDIPPLIYFMRKHHPKFISKKELGKGIPSVSYNLRHGGSVLIDRKKSLEAVNAIKSFAENIRDKNWAAVIFPEGTRSRNGIPKPFHKTGLITLFEEIPNAIVVPITINNSWKIVRNGIFPLGLGVSVSLEVHEPLKLNEHDHGHIIETIEKQITESVKME